MVVNNALARDSAKELAGLTQTDRERIATAIATAASPNTAATYRSRWLAWADWADSRGCSALPATSAHVAAWLTEIAASKSVATVKLSRAAIAKAHKLAGHSDPTAHDLVSEALRSVARNSTVSGRGPAKTASHDDIMAAFAIAMQPRPRGRNGTELPHVARVRGLEDRAMLGFGFHAAMRRSEIAALTWADIDDQADGIAVHVRRSKTNQDGSRPDTRWLANGFAQAVRSLRALRSESGQAAPSNRIFTLTPEAVGLRIRKTFKAAGLDVTGISAHSLRRAHATTLAAKGASIADICTSGGWQSADMVVRYASGQLASNNAVARYLT